MPPARVADAEVDFTGVRGKAMAHGALFLASLTAAGPLKVARSHWLAKALAKHLGADRPSTKVDVSVRLVAYVFTPAFIFDGALDVLPLPFWPLMARVAKLLRALIDAGMPSEDVGLPRQAQQLVLAFAAKLPLADRALARADVAEVIRPHNTWLDFATPELLRSSDTDNSMVAEFAALLVSACVDMNDDDRAIACIELMLDAPKKMANAIKAIEMFRVRTLESGDLRGLVPYTQITSEVVRRGNPSEAARFAPIFDSYHEVAYPTFSRIFLSLKGEGGELRRAVSALALGLKVTGPFTLPVAASVASLVGPLVGNLDLECTSSAPEDRASTLLRLHAEMPGGQVGRTVNKDGSQGIASEKVDKLVADPLFADLQTRLLACSSTDSVTVLKLLLSHKHPAGLVFVATARSIHLSAWAAYAGVKDTRMWQSAFNALLAIDEAGNAQPTWGDMISLSASGKPETVTLLVNGKLDAIPSCWKLCEQFVKRREGVFAMSQLPALPSPAAFWLSPEHMRYAEKPLALIFGFIGHDQSRSVTGSFREFYAKQLERATKLTRLPSNIVAFAPLVEATLAAVTLAFSSLTEYHTLMMAQPLHLMQRRVFLEPPRHGNAAHALESVDARIVKLREQVELAAQGLADHQDPGLQRIAQHAALGSTISTASPGSAASSLGPSASQVGLALSAPSSIMPAQPTLGVVPSSFVGSGAPLVKVGLVTGPAFPPGVFKGWGDMAVKLGVAKTPHGLAFGSNQCVFKGAAVTCAPGTCLAACAPGAGGAKARSKWCIDVTGCLALGYNAHDRPPGTTDDMFEMIQGDSKTDRANWAYIVEPNGTLLGDAPNGKWPLSHGPTGDAFNGTRAGAAPPGKKAGDTNDKPNGKKRKGGDFQGQLAGTPSRPPTPPLRPHLGRSPAGTRATTFIVASHSVAARVNAPNLAARSERPGSTFAFPRTGVPPCTGEQRRQLRLG